LSQTRLADADAVMACWGPRELYCLSELVAGGPGRAFREDFLEHMKIWREKHGAGW